MSCLISLLEDPIELLRKQIKDAAYSHDALFAKVQSLEAENASLRENLEPQPPVMAGKDVAEGDGGGDAAK